MKRKESPTQRIKLTLYHNAISFAEDALQNAVDAEKTNPFRWKFAILSMVQAIELTLKELLFRQHPWFIYSNIDKAEQNTLTRHTVTLEVARSRLKNIAKIELTTKESDALKTAENFRNKLVHYEFDEKLPELKIAFSRLLGFLNDFHRDHFEKPIQGEINPKLWLAGVLIQEYGAELLARAQSRLAADSNIPSNCVMVCRHCSMPALPAFGELQRCFVCNQIESFVQCDRCDAVMVYGDEEKMGSSSYCRKCTEYLSDEGDYLCHLHRDGGR